MDTQKVLIIVTGQKNRASLEKYFERVRPYANCFILYNSTLKAKELDLQRVFRDCCDLIHKENLKVVVSFNDLGSLVHAALCQAFPHIRGPSFLSVFTCLHKQMGKVIGGKWNVPYRIIQVRSHNKSDNDLSGSRSILSVCDGANSDGETPSKNIPYESSHHGHGEDEACLRAYHELHSRERELEVARGKMGYPCLIKPCLGTDSLLVKRVDNMASLIQYLAKCRHLLPYMLRPLEDLVNQFLDPALREDALARTLVVEELVEGAEVCNVDGMVVDGHITPWVISDNFYWTHRPRCFLGIGVPTQQPVCIQQSLWSTVCEIVQQLISLGFNHQFFNAEFFVFPDGRIRLMEMNGRMTQITATVCDHVFQDGDMIWAGIQIANGHMPPTPNPKPNRYGLKCYLSTFGTGVARDFVRFDEIGQIEDLEIFVEEESHVVQASGEAGFKLGYIDVFGVSWDDCRKQMDKLKTQIFKTAEHCPWFGN